MGAFACGNGRTSGTYLTRGKVLGTFHLVSAEIGIRGGAKRGVGETRRMVEELLERDLSTREIARLLDVSTQAVNQHLKRIQRDRDNAA